MLRRGRVERVEEDGFYPYQLGKACGVRSSREAHARCSAAATHSQAAACEGAIVVHVDVSSGGHLRHIGSGGDQEDMR